MVRSEIGIWRDLCRAAEPRVGSTTREIERAMVMLHAREDDPAFNSVFGLESCDSPIEVWEAAVDLAGREGVGQISVSLPEHGADWATAAVREKLRLVFESREVIWGRGVAADERFDPRPPIGLRLQDDAIHPDEFGAAVNGIWGFAPDHPRGALYAAGIGLPGWRHYIVRDGARPAGVFVLGVVRDIGWLMLALVDPAHRGRGLQSAMIERRLADAQLAGCTLAVSETIDDNASPRNLRRFGFTLVERRMVYRTEVRGKR